MATRRKFLPGSERDFSREGMLREQRKLGPLPPWLGGDAEEFASDLGRRELEATFTALQTHRAKANELAGTARSAAFEDWVRQRVVTATVPAEWTQAHVLYENYIDHAQKFGSSREQRALSVQVMATETMWGRMMATQFHKVRRTKGWYYPLRCKRA